MYFRFWRLRVAIAIATGATVIAVGAAAAVATDRYPLTDGSVPLADGDSEHVAGASGSAHITVAVGSRRALKHSSPGWAPSARFDGGSRPLVG